MKVVMDMSTGRIMEGTIPFDDEAAVAACGDAVQAAEWRALPQVTPRLEEIAWTDDSRLAAAQRGLMAMLYAGRSKS